MGILRGDLGGDIVGACRLIDGVDDSFVKGLQRCRKQTGAIFGETVEQLAGILMRTYGCLLYTSTE